MVIEKCWFIGFGGAGDGGGEMTVYKYYPNNDFSFDAMCSGYFYFNKVSKQNDPYDASYKLVSHAIRRFMQSKAEYKMKEYGTCSFSKDCKNKHMWAFYSSNYSGFVVEYDDNTFESYFMNYNIRIPYSEVVYIPNTCLLHTPSAIVNHHKLKVRYFDYHQIKADWSDPRALEYYFLFICSVKEKQTWSEEKEMRLIAANDVIKNDCRAQKLGIEHLDNGYKIPMPQNCIKKIIIGHNFPREKICIIKCIARKYGVEIFTTRCDKPFDIEIIKYEE